MRQDRGPATLTGARHGHEPGGRSRRKRRAALKSSGVADQTYQDLIVSTAGQSVRRRMLGLFRPYGWQVAGCTALVVLQIALSTVSPILLRWVIDDALPHRNKGYLILLCSGMFSASVLAILLGVIQSVVINHVTAEVVHRLRVAVYSRVQRMSLSFFSSQPVSEVETRITSDVGGISSAVTLTAQSAIAASVQILAALAAMLYLNWLLAVVGVSLGLLLSIITERAGRRRRRLAAQLQAETSKLMFAVSEDLSASGVLLGRTMLRFRGQQRRFNETSRKLSKLVFRQRLAGTAIRSGVGIAFAALPPLLYLLAGTATVHVSIGTVVVLTTLQARLSSPLQQLLGYSSSLASVSAMLERTFEYIDLRPEVTLPAAHYSRVDEARELSVRHLDVWYPDQPRPALADVSATFPPRSLTVVAGQTGSGKSTLALILAGQLTPSGGAVLYGDLPMSQDDLWRNVTLVPQETVLFNTTLRENLLFGAPYSSDEQQDAALIAAGLGERLDAMPDGLDTEVGERGYGLSGGERQRIGLARAILDPVSVLVFDEPTSAVDNETAAHLHTVLEELAKERTVVLITHRIPTLHGNHRVVVLNQGAVREAGTHAELLAAGGEYAELVGLQQVSPVDAGVLAGGQLASSAGSASRPIGSAWDGDR